MKLLAATLLLVLALLLAWAMRSGSRSTPGLPEALAPGTGEQGEVTTPLLLGASGRGPGRTARAPEAAAREEPGPTSITLAVVDDELEPIPGATVRTCDDSVEGRYVTDEAGECLLPIAPSGDSMRLEIDAGDRFHVREYFLREERMTVRMPRSVAMTGRVVDAETGATVAGALVELAHTSCKRCAPERTTSDESGGYHLESVPVARDAYFAVSAEGFPTDAFSFSLPANASDDFSHDFRLRRGIAVEGRIVDFTTGAPVAGASIQDAGRGTLMTTTDPGGRFSAAFLPGGYDGDEIEIGVAAPGYCRARMAFDPRELTEGPSPFPIRLPRVATVEGRMRDAAGAPVADGRVWVLEDVAWNAKSRVRSGDAAATPLADLPRALRLEAEDYGTARAQTDAEGRFRLSGFVPWTPHLVLEARHTAAGEASVFFGPLGAPGESTWVDVGLAARPAGGSLQGRLLLNGAPVRGRLQWRGKTKSGRGSAGADGRFRFDDVEAGIVELRAVPDRRDGIDFAQLFWSDPDRVTVTAGEDQEHDLALELSTTTISGRVLAPQDALARGPTVTAVAPGPRCRSSAVCAADGTYSLNVPAGEDGYSVSVTIGEVTRSRADVGGGETGVDFVFPALGRVRCAVVDAETGEPIERSTVAWSVAGEDERHAVGSGRLRGRDADGWVELELPSGFVDLHASNDRRGYLPATVRDVPVAGPGESSSVRIELVKGLAISLALANDQPPPPDDHRLYLFEEQAWEGVHIEHKENGWECDCGEGYEGAACLRRLVHFEGGRAELNGLPPGAYRFKSFPPGLSVEPERVEVTGAETEPFVVRWTLE